MVRFILTVYLSSATVSEAAVNAEEFFILSLKYLDFPSHVESHRDQY